MDEKKAPEREQRDTLTMRLPTGLSMYTKAKAEKMGVSQNAFLLMLVDLGIRMYEADFYINPHQ